MKRAFTILAAILVFVAVGGAMPRDKKADLILYDGVVLTMDDSMPRASAVAIKGDRIMYVGDTDGSLEYADDATRMIRIRGKTVVPGFNDNHVHSFGAGFFYLQPTLYEKSCQEIVDIVRAEAAKVKPGELILGNSWDYPYCPEPNRAMLDEAAPRNPVYLVQYSGHAAWVNSAMLEEMKIDAKTPDPEGGRIVRDAMGSPTGVLRDTAMGYSMVTRRMAKSILSSRRHREVMDKILGLYAAAGITSVQDNTWEPITARRLNKMKRNGALSCRFTCWPYGQTKGIAPLMSVVGFDDLWTRRGPWKYYADGAFSTRTAWMSEPYADEPGNYGEPRFPAEKLHALIISAAKNRRQVAVHAIGDRAVHEVVNGVEKAQALYPWTRDLRMRVEHAQLVQPEDIPRMKKLGIVVCVQPFAIANPEKDVKLLGEGRAAAAYPYRTFLDAGVHISFGSDAPAEVDFEPLLGIYYAVTRKNKSGTAGPLNEAERLTVDEALHAYTMGSAYAEFTENEKGSITVGKLADMVVLSDDPTAVDPEAIKDIEVLTTIVGGGVVYEKGEN